MPDAPTQRNFSISCALFYAVMVAMPCGALGQVKPASPVTWNPQDGFVWTTPAGTVYLDRGMEKHGFRVVTGGRESTLVRMPAYWIDEYGDAPHNAHLECPQDFLLSNGPPHRIHRAFSYEERDGGYLLHESLHMTRDYGQTVELIHPFTIVGAPPDGNGGPGTCVLPLKSGWARTYGLTPQALTAEYRLGQWLGGAEELALPLVQVGHGGEWQAAVCADPFFSAHFTLQQTPSGVVGQFRCGYADWQKPIEKLDEHRALFQIPEKLYGPIDPPSGFDSDDEALGPASRGFDSMYYPQGPGGPYVPYLSGSVVCRDFGFYLRKPPAAADSFSRSVDAFLHTAGGYTCPSPPWLSKIYMVKYDHLSDGGNGWDRDVAKLAEWLAPQERQHVALCLNGWYDYVGSYAFDETTRRMKTEWVAMPGTRKVPYTREKLQGQLHRARKLGFRVLLYFGDGMLQDSGAPNYHPEWNLPEHEQGPPRPTPEGRDVLDKLHIRNPAIPEAQLWYLCYMGALLADYGSVVDGFVWDETHYIRAGDAIREPPKGYRGDYSARAMLILVEMLCRESKWHSAGGSRAFLVSDGVGFPNMADAVGYGVVADGNFQDSWCRPEDWSYALFPNWRNGTWSVNSGAISNYHRMHWSVETFGAPVSISTGFADNPNLPDWTPEYRDAVLGLFRKRMAAGPQRLRYLTEDPAKLVAERGPDVVPSEVIPEPLPDEVNWALTSRGAQATASSEGPPDTRRFPAGGACDGSRSCENWGPGHGWISGPGLPQWLKVEFPQPRAVSHFVITTYHLPADSARKRGVLNYTIDIWDEDALEWVTVVREERDRILVTRAHVLSAPVTIRKFRVVVTRIMPGAERCARLRQVEAWGPDADAK